MFISLHRILQVCKLNKKVMKIIFDIKILYKTNMINNLSNENLLVIKFIIGCIFYKLI